MSKFAVATSLLALLALDATPVLARDARPFSFPSTSYYSAPDARRAADAFIARELPAGTPLTSAEEKLRAAGMGCTDGEDRESAVCHFYTLAAGDGGTLGEMWWTVYLQAGLDGRLMSAAFSPSRVGMSP